MSKKASYTPAEFAELVGVKTATVCHWCRIDRIECVRVSKRSIRIPHSEAVRLKLV